MTRARSVAISAMVALLIIFVLASVGSVVLLVTLTRQMVVRVAMYGKYLLR